MMELAAQAAFVAVVATFVSESFLMSRFRDYCDTYLVNCPVCMAFWLSIPFVYYGFLHYFLVVAASNAWMLVILKVYAELEKE
jgi:hypothetical protein